MVCCSVGFSCLILFDLLFWSRWVGLVFKLLLLALCFFGFGLEVYGMDWLCWFVDACVRPVLVGGCVGCAFR